MYDANKELTVAGGQTEKMPQKGELKLLALLLLIGITLFSQALKSDGVFQGVSSGPGSIPQIVSLLLIVLVLIEAINLVRKGYRDGTVKEALTHLFDKEVIILLVMVALYGLLVETLHFIPTSLLFMVGTMYLLDRKEPVKKAVISVVTLAALYLIFSTIFQVVLP